MRIAFCAMTLVLASSGAPALCGETPRTPALASSVSTDEEFGWEDPELWGAVPIDAIPDDSVLLIEWKQVAGSVRQDMRLYEDGHVIVETEDAGLTTARALRLPEDAMEGWRKIIAEFRPPSHAYLPARNLSGTNTSTLSVRTSADGFEHYRFSTAAALPSQLGTLRELLDALARAIVNDRQVLNPLSQYTPRKGDHLVDHDGVTYRIMRVVDEHKLVELRREEPPMTLWVTARDLYTMFQSIIPGGSTTR